jgi:hypothetical protein
MLRQGLELERKSVPTLPTTPFSRWFVAHDLHPFSADVDTAGTITVNEQADARGARPRLPITAVWRDDFRLGKRRSGPVRRSSRISDKPGWLQDRIEPARPTSGES